MRSLCARKASKFTISDFKHIAFSFFRVTECLVKGVNCWTLRVFFYFILFYFIACISQFFNKITLSLLLLDQTHYNHGPFRENYFHSTVFLFTNGLGSYLPWTTLRWDGEYETWGKYIPSYLFQGIARFDYRAGYNTRIKRSILLIREISLWSSFQS